MIVASEWSFGWEALVAVGTLGLAAATFVLALFTKRTAEAARAEIAANARPLLVDVPQEPRGDEIYVHFGALGWDMYASEDYFPGGIAWRDTEEGVILVAVPLRNAGTGPAMINAQRPALWQHDDLVATGLMDVQAIPPNGIGYAQFEVMAEQAQLPLFRVSVRYADVAGKTRSETILRVTRADGYRWRVEGVEIK